MKSKGYRLVTLLLCVLLVFSGVGCSSKTSSTTSEKTSLTSSLLEDGQAFTSLGTSQGMQIVAENSALQLLIDPVTTTMGIYVKSTGYLWKSNMTSTELEAFSDINADSVDFYRSQLQVTYYNSKNNRVTYSSYADCVVNHTEDIPTFALFSIQNGVRVVYSIGENIDDFLFPTALTSASYKQLISQMSSANAQSFAGFYQLQEYNKLGDSQKSSYATQYPLIKDEPIYIAKTVSKARKIRFVNDVLRSCGVNLSFIKDEYDAIGMKYTMPDAPNFTIPVEYTLQDGKMKVHIPMDEVEYDKDSYRLNSISVLPVFGSSTVSDSGYLVVPDGSGALIDLNTKTSDALALSYYGDDGSLWTDETAYNMQQATLPIFGMKRNDNAFVARVTDGEAMGTVEAHPKNSVNPFAYILTKYTIHPFETYVSQGMTNLSSLMKYSSEPYEGNIDVEYTFLTGSQANYSGMAAQVRSDLFGSQQRLDTDKTSFYMETYGSVLRKSSFLGFPYNADTSLTTVAQAKSLYDMLVAGGVQNISLRYRNWGGDRYDNGFSQQTNISGAVGSKSAMKELVAYVQSQGNTLYASVDPVLDYYSTNPINATQHSKYIDGVLAKYYGSGSDIWSDGVTVDLTRSILKSGVILDKLSGLLSKLDKYNFTAVSYETVGQILFSDFSSSDQKMRDDVKDDMTELLKQTKDSGKKILVDCGNAYALNYADDILEIPMSDSNLRFESQCVPFLQMVLHGYVSYAGAALNLSGNYEMEVLKAVEYGGGLRYVLNYAQPEMVKDTNYSYLYSTCYERWMDDAITTYQSAAKVLDNTQSALIIAHDQAADDVYVTTYDNGVKVCVNYGSADYTYNGTVVPAMGYALVK